MIKTVQNRYLKNDCISQKKRKHGKLLKMTLNTFKDINALQEWISNG